MAASDDYRYDAAAGPRDRSLRVGDKERDSVSEILGQRHVEGRLDSDEFQARLERCLSAKTYADLDVLIADFPRPEEERHHARRSAPWRPWPAVFPFLPLVVIAAIVAGSHLAWLAIPLFFIFVVRPLVWRGWGGRYARGWAGGPPRRMTRL
jgi:hypothetical protein